MASSKNQPTVGNPSDYVHDEVFGTVPKDAATARRLNQEAIRKGVPSPVTNVPPAVEEKVAPKA